MAPRKPVTPKSKPSKPKKTSKPPKAPKIKESEIDSVIKPDDDIVNPFKSREQASEFIRSGLLQVDEDYKIMRDILMDEINGTRGLEASATSDKERIALVESRTSAISALKTLQTGQQRFLSELMKSKKLLSELDPDSKEDDSLTIIIQLPNFKQVPIVGTRKPPSDESEEPVPKVS